MSQSLPPYRQHVRFGDLSLLHRHRDALRVDRVVLLAVLPDADPLHARRVDHLHVMSPPAKLRVNRPCGPARLEGNARQAAARTQQWLELLHAVDRGAPNHLASLDLAQRDLPRTQVQSYTSHGRYLLGPRLVCATRARGGVRSASCLRRSDHSFLPRPLLRANLKLLRSRFRGGHLIPSLRGARLLLCGAMSYAASDARNPEVSTGQSPSVAA
jgi:hypothetical protein